MSLSRLLWRLVVAGLGFSAAIVASLLVGAAATGTVAAGHRFVDGEEAGAAAFVLAVTRGGVVLPLLAAIVWPAWLGAVVLGEVTATRSLLVHLIVATAIAVVGVMGGAPVVGLAEIRSTVAVGLAAGFTHWLVAGRSAGLLASSRLGGAPRPPHDGGDERGVSGETAPPEGR